MHTKCNTKLLTFHGLVLVQHICVVHGVRSRTGGRRWTRYCGWWTVTGGILMQVRPYLTFRLSGQDLSVAMVAG